jgi:chromosome segregation ATPase
VVGDAEEARRLDRRRTELDHFARHLRRLRLRLAAAPAAAAPVAAAVPVAADAPQAAPNPEVEIRLREAEALVASLRKQAEVAAGHEEEQRRRAERLEREMHERDNLIDRLQARVNGLGHEVTSGFHRIEADMVEYRQELERDRQMLDEQLRQLQTRQTELDQAAREAELQMSRERAQLARERIELNRLRDDLRVEQQRLVREGGARERLAPLRRLKEELTDKRSGEVTPVPPRPRPRNGL